MDHSSLQWVIKSFNALSNRELYEILQFRMKIFMIEQNCLYFDLDDKDQMAYHCRGQENEKLIAYGRINFSLENAYIQRVCIREEYRQQKLGHVLMHKMLEFIGNKNEVKHIQLNAQHHLQHFYEKLGFQVSGPSFDDIGILHIPMSKKN